MNHHGTKINLPKEKLKALYISKKLSISQISRIFGCSVNPVHRALKEYKIPIRTISQAKRKVNISKKELERLYLQKKLSTGEISKILDCTHVTVLNRLKEFKIKSRTKLGTRKPVRIAKEELNRLYHQEKLTQKQIAKKFGHAPYGIQRWMKIYGIKSRDYSEANTKYPKYNFSGNLIEKAYMIGFRLGDLNVMRVKNLIQVRVSSTIPAQTQLFTDLFSNYGHVHIHHFVREKTGKKIIDATCLLNKSFKFLLPKEDKMPTWILNSKKYFLAFFAGYSDAEGSFYFKKPLNKIPCGVFTIQSYDKEIITSSAQMLGRIGISCYGPILAQKAGYVDKRGIRRNGDCWRFDVIKKRDLWKFTNLVEPLIRHQNKLNKVKDIKRNLIMRENFPYCHPIGIA